MVAPTARTGSLTRRLLSLMLDSVWARLLLAGMFVALVVLHWPDDSQMKSGSVSFKSKSLVQEELTKYIQKVDGKPNGLCFDPLWEEKPVKCKCFHPLSAAPVGQVRGKWKNQHDRLVSLANKPALNSLDVVILGDSITERMMGTRSLGTKRVPEFLKVFRGVFDKSTSSSNLFQGLALGASGDTSPELLYHLENGMLPESLNPRLWVILIGTNDLGKTDCSKEATVTGILHTANALQSARPNVPIVIHALLPRNDNFSSKNVDYSLGKRWQQIQWINSELKAYSSSREGWYYVDNNTLFLTKGRDKSKSSLVIDSNLMQDALHPTIKGYETWLPNLASQLSVILKNQT